MRTVAGIPLSASSGTYPLFVATNISSLLTLLTLLSSEFSSVLKTAPRVLSDF